MIGWLMDQKGALHVNIVNISAACRFPSMKLCCWPGRFTAYVKLFDFSLSKWKRQLHVIGPTESSLIFPPASVNISTDTLGVLTLKS